MAWLPLTKSDIPAVIWFHMIKWKLYISTSIRPVNIIWHSGEIGLEAHTNTKMWTLTRRSYDALWQIRNISSQLVQDLWAWNLAKWWLRSRSSSMSPGSCGHVTSRNKKTLYTRFYKGCKRQTWKVVTSGDRIPSRGFPWQSYMTLDHTVTWYHMTN